MSVVKTKTGEPIRIAISGPAGCGKSELLQRVVKALEAAEYEVVDADNGRFMVGPRARVEVFTTNEPLPKAPLAF